MKISATVQERAELCISVMLTAEELRTALEPVKLVGMLP